jgi:hypothetical protein
MRQQSFTAEDFEKYRKKTRKEAPSLARRASYFGQKRLPGKETTLLLVEPISSLGCLYIFSSVKMAY